MQKYAGFWIRFLALIIDGIILSVVSISLAFIIYGLSPADYFLNEETLQTTSMETIVSLIYMIGLPLIIVGATFGKKWLGIQMVKDDNSSVTFGTLVLRELVGKIIIYGFSLGIAAIVSAFMVGLRKDKKSIHDLISKTKVIYPNKTIDTDQATENLSDETVDFSKEEPNYTPASEKTTNHEALLTFIFGITSLFIPFVGFILAILGIVYYFKAKKSLTLTSQKGNGLAVAGLILSIISIVLYFLFITLFVLAISLSFY